MDNFIWGSRGEGVSGGGRLKKRYCRCYCCHFKKCRRISNRLAEGCRWFYYMHICILNFETGHANPQSVHVPHSIELQWSRNCTFLIGYILKSQMATPSKLKLNELLSCSTFKIKTHSPLFLMPSQAYELNENWDTSTFSSNAYSFINLG